MYALGIFDAIAEMSVGEYKESFKSYQGSKYLDFEELKQELTEAESDESWSWKEASRKANFYAYDEDISEEDLYANFKLLTWDVLFPEEK